MSAFHPLILDAHADHEYQLMLLPISRKVEIVTSFPFIRQTLFPVHEISLRKTIIPSSISIPNSIAFR